MNNLDINDLILLIIEEGNNESFLKKHGKKLLVAGGLAALGAGGTHYLANRKKESFFKKHRNKIIGGTLLTGTISGIHAMKNYHLKKAKIYNNQAEEAISKLDSHAILSDDVTKSFTKSYKHDEKAANWNKFDIIQKGKDFFHRK